MEHCNDAADNAHREQDLALLFHFRFATDSVDEPSGAANHDDCRDSLENQLRELYHLVIFITDGNCHDMEATK